MKIRDNLPLTLDRLRELLSYDPETGLWSYIKSRGRCKAGSIAGTLVNGYVIIYIDCVPYMAHRLAWFHMTGKWPEEEIDHKDTVKNNNVWNNLREASRVNNMSNVDKFSTNTTGYKGVYIQDGKYSASIKFNNERIWLGSFDTAEEASEAYVNKAKELQGEFIHSKIV